MQDQAFQLAVVIRNLPANAGDKRDAGSIPVWEDSPEEDMAIHSSILAWIIPMDRRAWQATVHRVTESDMTEAT